MSSPLADYMEQFSQMQRGLGGIGAAQGITNQLMQQQLMNQKVLTVPTIAAEPSPDPVILLLEDL